MSPRPHLLGLLPTDLAAHLAAAGVTIREGEARRVVAHVIQHERPGFPTERPVPKAVERAIQQRFERAPLEVVDRAVDAADGFVKLLLRSPDGALSEVVRIPLEKPGAYSACLSSQVGCAMGCAFCATGRLGFSRNLEAWEMVSAFLAVRADLQREARADGRPVRLSGAVFMGQGEPLLNLDEVLQAARVLSHPCGGQVKGESISISTAGIVPAMRRFTAGDHDFRLIVSLTSAVPERRAALMPVAARWSVDEVAAAVREYAATSRQRATVAFVVLGGVNTGDDEVLGLKRLFEGVPLRLNLIDVNDPRPDGFRRATDTELADFRSRLKALGVPVVRRYSGGVNADAACGMLASRASGVTPRS